MQVTLSPYKSVGKWIQPVDEKSIKLSDYDTGELSELTIETILERYPLEELPQVITYYGQKIQRGGTLRLMGPDLMRFSLMFSRLQLKYEDWNVFLGFRSALSADRILDNVPQGFRVLSWDWNGFNYIITVERL